MDKKKGFGKRERVLNKKEKKDIWKLIKVASEKKWEIYIKNKEVNRVIVINKKIYEYLTKEIGIEKEIIEILWRMGKKEIKEEEHIKKRKGLKIDIEKGIYEVKER